MVGTEDTKDYPVNRALPGYRTQSSDICLGHDAIYTKYPVGELFCPQPNSWTCGPCSLLNGLRAIGIYDVELRSLMALTDTNCENGTSSASLLAAAQHFESHCIVHCGSGATIDDLRSLLEESYVVIVNFREPNDGIGHFALVEAIGSEAIQFADPDAGPCCLLALKDFVFQSQFDEPPIEGWFLGLKPVRGA
ncbi:MAG: hypothetical protein KDD62_03220 [Bdellovibrionales bacterium]|nr:hypothetical protein [Bdellovibrionales bacterium]